MKTPYSKVAGLWHTGMVVSGLDAGLRRYMRRIPLSPPNAPRILDAGCGTGVLGLALFGRYPGASVLATDLDERMCENARSIANRRGIAAEQFGVGVSDLHEPDRVRSIESDETRTLADASFDIVVTGAVLEHADVSVAIPELVRLLRPGGYFVNVGMGDLPITKIYEILYGCSIIGTDPVITTLKEQPMTEPQIIPLTSAEFPANLTRVGIISRKN